MAIKHRKPSATVLPIHPVSSAWEIQCRLVRRSTSHCCRSYPPFKYVISRFSIYWQTFLFRVNIKKKYTQAAELRALHGRVTCQHRGKYARRLGWCVTCTEDKVWWIWSIFTFLQAMLLRNFLIDVLKNVLKMVKWHILLPYIIASLNDTIMYFSNLSLSLVNFSFLIICEDLALWRWSDQWSSVIMSG